jgi:hypothetical protein
MRGQALFAASAFAMMAFVQPASAQSYPSYHDEHVELQRQCAQSRQNRTVGGAIIGGLAGALLGREVADRGVRGEGAALGAVVGAAAGAGIGRSTAACDRVPQGSYDPYYGQPTNDDYYNGDYRESGYSRDDRDCRMGEIITRDRRGREYSEEALLCRGDDGRWYPAD